MNKFSVNFERSDQRGRPHGLKIIKKLNKKIIKRLRPGTSSYNFLNKFSVNFERSDPKDNKISNFAPDNNKKKRYGLDTRVQQALRVLPRHHRRSHARTSVLSAATHQDDKYINIKHITV